MSPLRKLVLLHLGLLASLVQLQPAEAFISGTRWTRTATDGIGLVQGQPTTLTWGIVPDGTFIPSTGGTSTAIAALDAEFGAGPGGSDLTQRPWFSQFEDSFGRWAELSGLSYVYEPNDDGVNHGTSGGALGVRPDLRIGADFVDGLNGTLAFNAFPNNGDMVLDTADMVQFGNPNQDFRFFKNTIMHEHGHGQGLFHIESGARFLMEPFLDTSIFGPQFDDVLGAHRNYGDFNEKSNGGNGNDLISDATDLGLVADGTSLTVGRDGRFLAVDATDSDFLSIDGTSDTDFFAFSVSDASTVDVTLRPIGPTYNFGPEGGSQSQFISRAQNDLSLALFDSDQVTELASDNSGGLGMADMVSGISLSQAGDYYVRVLGSANAVQMFEVEISVMSAVVACDFNGDTFCDGADIDMLVAEIVAGTNDPTFDLNNDDVVDVLDRDAWLAEAGALNLPSEQSYLLGDANLDGTVDGQDFIEWNSNKFTTIAAWTAGDFNVDGFVDGQDFIIWNTNKFTSADLTAVPEPASLLLGALGCLWLVRRKRR